MGTQNLFPEIIVFETTITKLKLKKKHEQTFFIIIILIKNKNSWNSS
jgi:hypothetical protein